jgi:hypothetical protein
MREYTMHDAFGKTFVPQRDMDPAEVYVQGEDTPGGWVPWSIARIYPEDVTMDEILADLAAESEVSA